uniref:Uncharacterized protein n=1 Tax=Psilocybe cubensis TaxID=181762 RepID=A0A8H8CPZ7_PSICU
MESVIEDFDSSDASDDIKQLPNHSRRPFPQIENFPDIDLFTHDFGELNVTSPVYHPHVDEHSSSRHHRYSAIDRQQHELSANNEGNSAQRFPQNIPHQTQQNWSHDVEHELRRISGSSVRRLEAQDRSSTATPEIIQQFVSVMTGTKDDYGALLGHMDILGPLTSHGVIGEVYNHLHFIVFGYERDAYPPTSLSYTPVNGIIQGERTENVVGPFNDNDPGSISAPNSPRDHVSNQTSIRVPIARAAYDPPPPSTPSPRDNPPTTLVDQIPNRPQELSVSSTGEYPRSARQTSSNFGQRDTLLMPQPLQAPILPRQFTTQQEPAVHSSPRRVPSPEMGATSTSSTTTAVPASLLSPFLSTTPSTSTASAKAYLAALSAKVNRNEFESVDGGTIAYTVTILCSEEPLADPPIDALDGPPEPGDLLFNQYPNSAQSLRNAQVWIYLDSATPQDKGNWLDIKSQYGTFSGPGISHPKAPDRYLTTYAGKEGRPRWIKKSTWESNQRKHLEEVDRMQRISKGRATATPTPSAAPSTISRRSTRG